MKLTNAQPPEPSSSGPSRPDPRSWLMHLVTLLFLLLLMMMFAGCTAPPSVSPLLRVSQLAMQREIQHLQTDRMRDEEHLRQTRQSLDVAFEADLERIDQAGDLNAQWIRDAMLVYVPAREALLRHEATLEQERLTRMDNLQAAAEAQQRALQLIENQNALITNTTHFNMWRLLQLDNSLMLER